MTVSNGVYFHTDYFDLVKDINAALVMSQIHYWYMPDSKGKSKLRVFKEGKYWLAKSNEEWWDELRMTRRQVDRAITLLERRGLISVSLFRFNGAPTRHITCDFLAKIPLSKRKSIAPISAFDCTHTCKPLHTEVQSITETTTEITTDILYAGEVSAGAINGSEDMNADEVLKNFQSKQVAKTQGNNVSAMALLWKKRVSLHQQWVKNLLPKEVGQLKHVREAIGDSAIEVMDWALQNWQVFAHEVQAKKGVAPALAPHVGFFCANWDVAANLKDIKTKKPVVQSIAQNAIVAKKPVHNQANDENLATPTEIQATLETLAALAAGKSKGS